MFKIPPQSNPTLTSLQDKGVIVHRQSDIVESGIYELTFNPNVPFVDIPLKPQLSKTVQTISISTQTITSTSQVIQSQDSLPLKPKIMKECTDRMLQLIASIPPRYILYNKLLSAQIDSTLEEVESLTKYLRYLHADYTLDQELDQGLKVSLFATFLQYRILNMLHDIWKKVWTRFSPPMRVFSVSKIHQLHTLDQAEDLLNRLCMWRRMMNQSDWNKIKGYCSQHIKGKKKAKILLPDRLVSDEHAGDYIQLTTERPKIQTESNSKAVLDQFRLTFLKESGRREAYTVKELKNIMNDLLASNASISSTHFPCDYIEREITREFLLFE
ncbi:hypothetical protein HK103_000137 [Boothiomyces macroporosus]|uniref:Uncharacterized protein n=1 Tax=Boothiomyces macroporosus TaxID=261099 RepID=A0AAD5UPX9_9FUNG|nr:hypothetical protein HK103_000137 [Boothiomyces macroporosus]